MHYAHEPILYYKLLNCRLKLASSLINLGRQEKQAAGRRLPQFAYVAVTLSMMTIAARATNNMIMTTVSPFARHQLGFGNTLVGILTAASFMASFVATSYLNPKLTGGRRRNAFIISNGAIALSLPLFYLSSAVTVWFITVLAGFASGIVMPNLITSASTGKDPKTTEKLLAIYTASLSASLVIGPSVETQLLNFANYRSVFLFFGILAIACLLLSVVIDFPEIERESRGKTLLNTSGFVSSLLANSTYAIPFAAITTFLAIYAGEKFNISNSAAYQSFIPFFAISFITRLVLVAIPLRSLKLFFMLSVCITIAGLIGMALSPSYVVFLAVMALLGLPHGTVYPMSTIMIARGTRREERNAVNSYFLAFNNLTFAGVPFAVGALSAVVGLGSTFLLLTIPVSLSAFAFLHKFRHNAVMTG